MSFSDTIGLSRFSKLSKIKGERNKDILWLFTGVSLSAGLYAIQLVSDRLV